MRTCRGAQDTECDPRVAENLLLLVARLAHLRLRAAIRGPQHAPDRLDHVGVVLVAAAAAVGKVTVPRGRAQALATVRDPGGGVRPAELDALEALRERGEGEVERRGGEGEMQGRGRGCLWRAR